MLIHPKLSSCRFSSLYIRRPFLQSRHRHIRKWCIREQAFVIRNSILKNYDTYTIQMKPNSLIYNIYIQLPFSEILSVQKDYCSERLPFKTVEGSCSNQTNDRDHEKHPIQGRRTLTYLINLTIRKASLNFIKELYFLSL